MIKDYNYTINYHPGKANKVIDALSRKAIKRIARMTCHTIRSLVELRTLHVEFAPQDGILIASMHVKPLLESKIQEKCIMIRI